MSQTPITLPKPQKMTEKQHIPTIPTIPTTPHKMSSNELNMKILDILSEGELLNALEISKKIFGKGARRKLINPSIYRLLMQKKVTKYPPIKGMKPRWGLYKEESKDE